MDNEVTGFSQSAVGFARSPLGIIALFIVLVYGFATMAATFGDHLGEQAAPLIYFLVLFPVIVFAGFLWMVANHSNKLYGPQDFKSDEQFLKYSKRDMETAASLAAAIAKNPTATRDSGEAQQQLDSILHSMERAPAPKKPEASSTKTRSLLWVDDNPDNNVYERKAFESQDVRITLARSTQEALDQLSRNTYTVIISDMGRKEGHREGYVLLEKLRDSGDRTPYFIYAGSNFAEHQRMATDLGAQGTTNRPQELFEMVMRYFN